MSSSNKQDSLVLPDILNQLPLLKGDIAQHITALNEHAIVSTADTQGNITYVNALFCEISGYQREELVGKNHRILKSGTHEATFYQQLWETIAKGLTWHGIICNRRKDGTFYWVKSTITPCRDTDGAIYQYVSVRTDITTAIQSEQQSQLYATEIDNIVTHLQTGIIIVDANDRISRVNDFMLNLLDADKPQLQGNFIDVLKNFSLVADVLALYKQYKQNISGNYSTTICSTYRKKTYWLEIKLVPNLDKTGQLSSSYIIVSDVTDQHKKTIKLESNQRRFDLSQSYAKNGTWEWNIVTGDLFWSAGVTPVFGHKPGSLNTSYENFINAVHPDDRDLVQQAIQDCIEKHKPYLVEHRIIWPNKEIHWVRETGDVERDSNGSPLRMLGVVQNIDYQKKLQNQLELQHAINNLLRKTTIQFISNSETPELIFHRTFSSFNKIIDSHQCLFAVVDSDKSPRKIDYFRWIDNPDFTSQDIDSNDAPDTRRMILEWCLQQEESVSYKNLAEAQNIPTFLKLSGFRNFFFYPAYVENQLLGFYVLFDVNNVDEPGIREGILQIRSAFSAMLKFIRLTRREQQTWEELLLSKKEAEEANNTKSRFLASISHELRTPLNAILGYSELMGNNSNHNIDDQNNILHIHQAGQHLLNIINELLDLSQIESGALSLKLTSVDLSKLLDECIAYVIPMSRKEKVTIIRSSFEYIVHADYTRLKQVIINLLSNAIKYNSEQGLVFIKAILADNNQVRLDVQDTGIGIRPEYLDKVFEPFERLDKKQSSIQGTGIGLVVTKQIIESMGGKITFTTQYEIGSTFSIDIPLEKTQLLHSLQRIHPSPHDKLAKVHFKAAPGSKVLLVDDSPFNLDLSRKQLESLGYEVTLAKDGSQAIKIWEQGDFNLVITDINMPIMNGYELLSLIRQSAAKSHQNTKVLAMTANALPEEQKRISESGFNGYISKPTSISDLQAILLATTDTSQNIQQEPDINTGQIFNPEILREYADNDLEVERNLLEIFLEDAPATMKHLRDQLEQDKFDNARKQAHTLKSTVSAIGYQPLREGIEKIEQLAQDQDKVSAMQELESTEQFMQTLIGEIKKYIE